MKKRWRAVIFIVALILVGGVSLISSTRAFADLVFSPVSAADLRTQVILRPRPAGQADPADLAANLHTTQQIVTERLEQLSLAGSYHLATESDKLMLTLAENEYMPHVLDIVSQVGQIEFIDGGTGTPPLGQYVKTNRAGNPEQGKYPLLFTAQEISQIIPPSSDTGQIFYRLTLTPAAAQRFSEFAVDRPEHYVCMVMDGQVVNCSGMYHWAEGTLDILPNLGSGAAINLADMAVFVESGPLPMPLIVEH